MIKLIAKSKELNAELEKLYNQVKNEMEEAKNIVEKHIGVKPVKVSMTNVFGVDYIILPSSFSFDKEIDSHSLKYQSKEMDGTFVYKLLKSRKEGKAIAKEFEKFNGIDDETLVPFGIHTWNGRQYGGFCINKTEDNVYYICLSNSCFDKISLISKHYTVVNSSSN